MKAYLSGVDMSINREERLCELDEKAKEELQPYTETHISFIRATAAMGVSRDNTKWIIE